MNKKKITVLVNKSAGHESYVEFLKERFDVKCIDASERICIYSYYFHILFILFILFI